ncbi:PstS family phosphate ABC transporter substrate-binding protein [Paenibacillus donghaensis]|uniref:PBP domain-containing protein n=1 Tax=Paenibacillus donghaensis TaxID=414771 RepID=A0A2Z2KBB8_9BACL|nr:substrate-binding domain-containing protein [Paenibacillus donghaensis]ASA22994.1 hypothetical protein B9T62_20600 [Paenibacillus donghaensis]
MNNSFGTKLLSSIVAVLGVIAIGFVASLLTGLFGGLIFYVPLLATLTVGFAIYSVISIFRFFSLRIRRISLISFLGVCLLATAGYEINKAYHNSFATVSDQEVNLRQYEPFQTGSKVAVLSEDAEYKLSGDIPRLDGATALYPLYSAFVQAVYPSGTYEPYALEESPVVSSTTPEAYKRLINGETDIIFVASPSLAQQKEAKRQGVELKLTPIGREAFVFFVNRNNAVRALTTAQIKDIYSGKLTNWQDVGGRDDKIRAFQRPADSGSQTMLEKYMGDTPIMEPLKDNIADAMSGIIKQTASYRNYKNALGYSFLFYASEMNASGDIKLLAIDGAAPNKENIRNGSYPLTSEFYAVTAGSSNPNVQHFLDFILSPQGQELIEKTGYTALK